MPNCRLSALALMVAACLPGCFSGCDPAKSDLQARVFASLRQKGASVPGISVDSVRLESRSGPVYPGWVFLSAGGTRERDSVAVRAGISSLEYDFPAPGDLAARVFR